MKRKHLNKFKLWINNKQKQKEMDLNISVISFAFAGVLVGFMLLFLAYYLVIFIFTFTSHWHNIDIALNHVNQECNGCIWNVTDTGITWSGKMGNQTLAEGYIYGMHYTKKTFFYSNITSYFLGFLSVTCLFLFISLGIESRKLDEFREKKKCKKEGKGSADTSKE